MAVIKQMILCLTFASMVVTEPFTDIDTEPTVLIEMEATAYYEGTICYDGTKPIVGQTCGSAKKYIGCTFILYENLDGVQGEFIGIYRCNDTGSDYRIENGTVVDLFMTDYETCMEWGRRDVLVEIVK